MVIYADNAATTKLCKPALEAMVPFFGEIYGNPSSLHFKGDEAARALEEAKRDICRLLGFENARVIFTSSGSEANCQAIFTGAKLGEKMNKKHIVSTAFEHSSVSETLDFLSWHGFEITRVLPDENGFISFSAIKKAIRPDTCLVSVMSANNEAGTLQPVAQIAALCKNSNILFHTDAVQAAGHILIDNTKINADMISISAHKFHGPKGAGALIIKNGIEPFRLIYGGATQGGTRGGTVNTAGAVGMAAALEYACGSLEENFVKTDNMRKRLIDGLCEINGAHFNGAKENSLPSIVNFSFDGVGGEALALQLDAKGICASSGSACASGNTPSKALKAMGRSDEAAFGSLRLSISEENTDEEIETIIKTVKETVKRLREDI